MFEYNGFEAAHDFSRLPRVRSRAHRKIHIGGRNSQLLEEYIRHIGVIMLSGVDQGLLYTGLLLECPQDRSHFHEVWPSAYDMKNVHRLTGLLDVIC